MNFRNRHTFFSEFFSEIMNKIANELIYDEKASLFSINSKYTQKSQYALKKFKANLASAALKRQAQARSEPSILNQEVPIVDYDISLENFDYESEMKSFFENLIKGSLNTKSINIVSKVFKEFGAKEFDSLFEKSGKNLINEEGGKQKQEKKRGNSLKHLKEKTVVITEPLNGKKKKKDKIDENSSAMKKEEEIGFNLFLSEGKKRKKDGSKEKNERNEKPEKNEKKRKLNEHNKDFSEFLENAVEIDLLNSSKKKRNIKGFL